MPHDRSSRKRAAQPPTRSQIRSRQAFVEEVHTKLAALGHFDHLEVRHDGQHIVIEQKGPPEDPDVRQPVLRLTPLGGLPVRFGLSFATHEERWEKVPVSGLLADVLSTAVAMFSPYLAPDF